MIYFIKKHFRSNSFLIFNISFLLMFMFYLYLTKFTKSIYIAEWPGISTFYNTALSFIIVITSIYKSKQYKEYTRSLMSRGKYNMYEALTILFQVLIINFITILVLSVCSIYIGVNKDIILNSILVYFTGQTFIFLFIVALGFIIGRIKSNYAYIIGVILVFVFSPAGKNFINNFIYMDISNLLYPFPNYINIPVYSQFINSFSNFEIYKLLNLLSISVVLFICSSFEKNMNRFYFFGLISFVLLSFFSIYKINLTKPSYKYVDYNSGLEDIESDEIKVNYIKLNIEDSRELNVKSEYNLEVLKNIDKIGFVLEENLLNNSEVLIDGKKYKINSDGDSAYINLDNTIQKGESINVSINYFGNINYLLNTGVRCYFYSKNQLNLPNGYPWYPIFDNCNKKNIELNIKNKSNVFSNLMLKKREGDLYVFEGNAKDLYISAGDYIEKNINEFEVVLPREMYIKNRKEVESRILYEKDFFDIRNIRIFLGNRLPAELGDSLIIYMY